MKIVDGSFIRLKAREGFWRSLENVGKTRVRVCLEINHNIRMTVEKDEITYIFNPLKLGRSTYPSPIQEEEPAWA